MGSEVQLFSFGRLENVFPKVLGALPATLLIVVTALAIGGLLGLLIAFVRVHRIPVLDQLAVVYISFVRSTPEIVQLFIVYYGVPLIAQALTGVDLSAVEALYFVLIAFGINQSAYLAELFRGGFEAVPAGQYEAGDAVGLTRFQTFRRVIVPQAVQLIIPGLGITIIALFRNTSIAATLGVADMMGKAGLIGAATYHYLEPYVAATIIFLVISIALELLFRQLNKRVVFGRRQTA